jgi:hypothetical protein
MRPAPLKPGQVCTSPSGVQVRVERCHYDAETGDWFAVVSPGFISIRVGLLTPC